MEKHNLDKLQRILDFQLNRDDADLHEQTKSLIASDKQLNELNAKLERMLDPLAGWENESPPADLTERTLRFIEERKHRPVLVGDSSPAVAGDSSDDRKHRLDKELPTISRSRWILHNLRDIVAAAACIMLVFVLMNPGLKYARQIARQQACAAQLQQIGYGLRQYAGDQNGLIPYVKRVPGTKWWHVGRQDNQHISNNANLYLLVKQGYLPAQAFLCPSRDNHKVRVRIKIDPQLLKTLQDFAGREDNNYSFRLILSNQFLDKNNTFSTPLISDQNPLFADFDSEQQEELDLSGQMDLLQMNSPNHAGRGQNMLFSDGRVIFSPDRRFGPDLDDIFTIQSMTRYRGIEQPASAKDYFIAP